LRKSLDVGETFMLVLGGRVVLINSVLTSIPILFLSFLKMSKRVWKALVKIQCRFLWGTSSSTKILWIKWAYVCKNKEENGFGYQRLENLQLGSPFKMELVVFECVKV